MVGTVEFALLARDAVHDRGDVLEHALELALEGVHRRLPPRLLPSHRTYMTR